MTPVRCAGVDIGGTTIITADWTGNIRSTNTPATYPELVDAVADLLSGATARVLVGIPGTTTAQSAGWVPALPFLNHQPLAADLAQRTGGSVTLDNDARLALVGEHSDGVARGCEDVVLLSVGTGIGGAVMAHGRLLYGASGVAGSFGWLAAECPSGDQHGAFERSASGRRLNEDAAAAGFDDSHALIAAAREGDPAAAVVVSEFGRRLGRGVAALASIFDPELIIVAGGVSTAFDVIGEHLIGEQHRQASPQGRLVPVRAAALGASSGAVGALRSAQQKEASDDPA